MTYLTHSAQEYHKAAKYFKALLLLIQDNPERDMSSIALEALRYAAIRVENPPLTRLHLQQMHGQPVYCTSISGGQTGGGIIDANKEQVILLDHDGVFRDSWFWNSTGKYYRFPLNGVDLLKLDQTE